MPKEYKVVRLRNNTPNKNEILLNELANEGWELINTTAIQKLAANGSVVSEVHAYLHRNKKKKQTING